jgi:preprotein translocase subunit SecB
LLPYGRYVLNVIFQDLVLKAQNWPDPEKLLRVNGASILYSSAREFLITVTSRGPWAPMILPTISFLPVEENKSKESKPKKKQTTKKTKSTT